MACSICDNPIVENKELQLCASCNHERRKAERAEIKSMLKDKPIAIKKISAKQSAINNQYSKSLKERYQENPNQKCAGCGEPATCTAHIIAKSRLKIIGKTPLIWNKEASFPSCYSCNLAIENPKGQSWKELANIEECLAFIEKHDKELYQKFMNNL